MNGDTKSQVDEHNQSLAAGSGVDAAALKKVGKAGIDRQAKTSWTALFHAVANGRLDTARVLLGHGANPEKQLSVAYGKITPMMLAAANGDLDMVKLLFDYAKAEKQVSVIRTRNERISQYRKQMFSGQV